MHIDLEVTNLLFIQLNETKVLQENEVILIHIQTQERYMVFSTGRMGGAPTPHPPSHQPKICSFSPRRNILPSRLPHQIFISATPHPQIINYRMVLRAIHILQIQNPLLLNVNSIVEAPQTDKKERKQRKKKCFDNDSDNLGKPIIETTFRKTSVKDFVNIV